MLLIISLFVKFMALYTFLVSEDLVKLTECFDIPLSLKLTCSCSFAIPDDLVNLTKRYLDEEGAETMGKGF